MNYRILVERSVAEMSLPGESTSQLQDVAHQSLIERGMLQHLTDALRATVSWKVESGDFTRKLSTLRFIMQSFQRHLERLMALEENDGYLDLVEDQSPQLSKTVACLRREHDVLRADLRRLVHQVDNVYPTDAPMFEQACHDVLDYLHRLDEHSAKEVKVFQEAVERDGGGEG